MRRPVGLVLICLGAFFLSLAPLVRFYVADQVVRAPLNRYQVTTLEGKNATYFDLAALETKKGATLRARNTVRGDVRANGGNDRIAVWDSSTNIFDVQNPDKPIQIQSYRIAFDRRTSVLVNCCGSNVGGDTNVKMSGYGLLFPLANVEKRDYPFYNTTTRQVVPMRYSGEEKVKGLDTYRFIQEVPNTKIASLETELPAEMLGMDEDAPDQKVDRYSRATITAWVDPRTGIPVKHRQQIHSTVRTEDGKGRMVVASADLVTVDASVQRLVDMADDNALKIEAVRVHVPLGALLLGLALLLAGAFTGLSGDGRRTRPPAPRRADGKFGEPVPARGTKEAPESR